MIAIRARVFEIKLIGDKNNGDHILNTNQVLEIIDLLLAHQMTIQAIANKYHVSKHAIESIKYKKTWKHLTKDIDFYNYSHLNNNLNINLINYYCINLNMEFPVFYLYLHKF